MIDLAEVIGFEWDEGNSRKNEQHGVSMTEAEQVFFNSPLLVLSGLKNFGVKASQLRQPAPVVATSTLA